jgi:hypothetical protein
MFWHKKILNIAYPILLDVVVPGAHLGLGETVPL